MMWALWAAEKQNILARQNPVTSICDRTHIQVRRSGAQSKTLRRGVPGARSSAALMLASPSAALNGHSDQIQMLTRK
jgi:hypothetical protein